MEDVLTRIIAAKRIEVERDKQRISPAELRDAVAKLPVRERRSMRSALASSASGIIAEFKRRSPSKGWINEGAEATVIPPAYAAAGAAALSILTDTEFFGGSLEDLIAARPLVDIPIIRKEFIVDDYQLYQAKLVGADAVLLIAAALSTEECVALTRKAHELELEVLLELHSQEELEYITDEVDMVGINNRNLGTFHTDVANSYRLAELLPQDMVKVSESGISDPQCVVELRKAGFQGFLIGENFMRTEQPGESLRKFISVVEQ
ncbi:MAG: indole-3-glycerol phosphate synthase TrpC [Rikenellaceae bacterium]